jgi:hypothetical protein
MVRRKIRRKPVKKTEKTNSTKVKLNMGSLSFLAILIVSAVASLFVIPEVYSNIPLLLIALLGAIIAIDNITKNEELMFMVACATIMIVSLAFTSYIALPEALRIFIAHLAIAFGVGGFIVALGAILKLGWTK